jgi:hypothetical protein
MPELWSSEKMSSRFCPWKNVLQILSLEKCPPDFVLGKMSFEVNVLDKNVL